MTLAPVLLQQVIAPRSQNNLVINIGYVHYILNFEFEVLFQNPPQNIERYIVPCVAHVGNIINCRPAYVP